MVDAILDHREIKTFSFVGSTPVAQYVHSKASANGKRVQALGGAKNHAIVLPDADMEQTANAIIGAAYGSAGERCMAISVVVAVDTIADQLRDLLVSKANALSIGPGDEDKNDMGPLITAEHKQKVLQYIEDGVSSNAELVIDGRSHPIASENPGFFLGPTFFDHVKDFEEGIALANDHQFGNGVALFTSKGSYAREFVNRVEVGMVGINIAIPVPLSFYSFGGWKDSIYGDSNIYGEEGIRFYTRIKTVTTRWPDLEEENRLDLSMPVIE
jgi:malonate-semialdehyde dehydrogenase (acetylating)/methylmalonate-semialdehyde dehydrogenase